MSEQLMNRYPHLKEAILTNKSVETSQEEIYRLRGIFEFFDTNIIQYLYEYYEVGIWYAD